MKTIHVYDPPMCCSTGVCGTNIDPDVVGFGALLSRIGRHGVTVERYNMAQQPMAFAQNPVVKELLEKEGTAALPLILWDGTVHSKGRYPTSAERPAFLRAALGTDAVVAP
jgi:hypothetical protein